MIVVLVLSVDKIKEASGEKKPCFARQIAVIMYDDYGITRKQPSDQATHRR